MKENSADNFARRVVTSLILVASVTAIVYLLPNWLYAIVVALFIAFGLADFFRLVEKRNIFVYKYFGVIVGSLIPIVIYLGNGFPDVKNLEPILIVVASLFAFVLQFTRRDNAHDHLVSMALTLFSLLYIGWFFSFLVKIKFLLNGSSLVFFLIMVTKSADIGAYLIGKRFGSSELISRISPKKTKEGVFGGILFSLVFSVVLGKFLTSFTFLHLSILGIMLATLGQIGDLAESLIKRDCDAKDSGTYLGSMGGVLDLIDSLLFTTPVFYFYVKTF